MNKRPSWAGQESAGPAPTPSLIVTPPPGPAPATKHAHRRSQLPIESSSPPMGRFPGRYIVDEGASEAVISSDCTFLTWTSDCSRTGIHVEGQAIVMEYDGEVLTGVLEADRAIHWNDGDVWPRVSNNTGCQDHLEMDAKRWCRFLRPGERVVSMIACKSLVAGDVGIVIRQGGERRYIVDFEKGKGRYSLIFDASMRQIEPVGDSASAVDGLPGTSLSPTSHIASRSNGFTAVRS